MRNELITVLAVSKKNSPLNGPFLVFHAKPILTAVRVRMSRFEAYILRLMTCLLTDKREVQAIKIHGLGNKVIPRIIYTSSDFSTSSRN